MALAKIDLYYILNNIYDLSSFWRYDSTYAEEIYKTKLKRHESISINAVVN